MVVVVAARSRWPLAKLVDSVAASNSETMLGGIGLAKGVINVLDFLGGPGNHAPCYYRCL